MQAVGQGMRWTQDLPWELLRKAVHRSSLSTARELGGGFLGKLLGGQSFWPIWEGRIWRVEDMARREVVLCRVRVREYLLLLQ